jgi:hypothetical protein
VAASGTLIAAGKSSRNGGLVWIGDALAPIDGLSDASSGVGIEAMLEGESPLGVAALPNRVVHGGCCTPGWVCRREDGRRRAGLEFVEKLLTKLNSADTTERNAGMLRGPLAQVC